MKRQWRLLLFSTLGSLLMVSVALAAPSATHTQGITNWNNLSQLTSGAEIKVVLTNRKSRRVKFERLTPEAIVVESGHGQQRFNRQNVLRVWVKGKSHRLRNALIGAAVGAGAGLALGAYVDANPRAVFNLAVAPNAGKEIFAPSFAVVGVVVGVALPARKWRDIYRSR